MQASADWPEGEWLVAKRQTAGRGRMGRHWDSAEGNFHGSTLVRLRESDPAPATLSLVAGIAVHAAVAECAAGVEGLCLKWPNDLMLGTGKLAGVLVERSGDSIVCGIGVNLGWAPAVAGRETTCLANAGHIISVEAFAARLAMHFAASLDRWRSAPLPETLGSWLVRGHPKGTRLVRPDGSGGQLTGQFDGLEEDGSLRLRQPDGSALIISSGEVLLG